MFCSVVTFAFWVTFSKRVIHVLLLVCQLAPDAAQVDGGDVQIGGNFLDGEQLQDVGASVQQLAVALLGRQAEHVEVAGIDVQKQLLDGDAARALIFHVALI